MISLLTAPVPPVRTSLPALCPALPGGCALTSQTMDGCIGCGAGGRETESRASRVEHVRRTSAGRCTSSQVRSGRVRQAARWASTRRGRSQLPASSKLHGRQRGAAAGGAPRRRPRRVQRIHRRLRQQAAPHRRAVVGLRHAAHELARYAQQHVGGQIEVGVLEVLRDPGWQLVALVVPLVPLVCKAMAGEQEGGEGEGSGGEEAGCRGGRLTALALSGCAAGTARLRARAVKVDEGQLGRNGTGTEARSMVVGAVTGPRWQHTTSAAHPIPQRRTCKHHESIICFGANHAPHALHIGKNRDPGGEGGGGEGGGARSHARRKRTQHQPTTTPCPALPCPALPCCSCTTQRRLHSLPADSPCDLPVRAPALPGARHQTPGSRSLESGSSRAGTRAALWPGSTGGIVFRE